MPAYVALLRGINVGKAKRVPMAELRALLSGLGYTGVATLLNSGNAVFHARTGAPAKHAAAISAAISTRLKIEVPVVVKSASELTAIISENPIKAGVDEHSHFLVAFVQNAGVLPSLAAVESLVGAREKFSIGKNAAYLLCPTGILESKAWEALVGKTGKSATTRNWATVLKLQALVHEADV